MVYLRRLTPAVTPPAITWKGTNGNNLWVGQTLPKVAIVCHIMDGTIGSCDSWFANPASQASANFGVGKDGSIHMYVDPEGPNSPWANGAINHPDAIAQALFASQGGRNPNWYTISIEHEGKPGDALTSAQLMQSARLAAYYMEKFGIPNDTAHTLGHFQIDSVNRPRCPGWSAVQWQEWRATVGAILAGTTAATEPEADRLNEVLGARFALARQGLGTLEQAFAADAPQMGVRMDRNEAGSVLIPPEPLDLPIEGVLMKATSPHPNFLQLFTGHGVPPAVVGAFRGAAATAAIAGLQALMGSLTGAHLPAPWDALVSFAGGVSPFIYGVLDQWGKTNMNTTAS